MLQGRKFFFWANGKEGLKYILNVVENEKSTKNENPGRHLFFQNQAKEGRLHRHLSLPRLTVHCREVSPGSFRQGPVGCFEEGVSYSQSKTPSSRVHLVDCGQSLFLSSQSSTLSYVVSFHGC